MKKLLLSAALLMSFFFSNSCSGQVKSQVADQAVDFPKVTLYYFHFTRRCATCMAVEENARKAIEALYPKEVKRGEYSFSSMNLDEPGTKAIADKLGVGGQTLIAVHGDKKADITSAGWMAAHDLEKMKKEIKSGIEKVSF